jgi:hypothetical protein
MATKVQHPTKVKFKVKEVCDSRKQGSNVSVDAVLVGFTDKSGKRVYYRDAAYIDWIFYVGDTCEIVEGAL